MDTIKIAFQAFSEALGTNIVEHLIGYKGNNFAVRRSLEDDLPGIMAVHPIHKEFNIGYRLTSLYFRLGKSCLTLQNRLWKILLQVFHFLQLKRKKLTFVSVNQKKFSLLYNLLLGSEIPILSIGFSVEKEK